MAILLVTANVGSIFEDPRLMPNWVEQFTKTVIAHKAGLVALHMQEFGGKKATSDGCEALLQRMMDTIMGSKGMEGYDRLLGYCDTDTSDEEKYTALGSVYLLHRDVSDAAQFDYVAGAWVPIARTPVRDVQCNGESAVFVKTKFTRGQHGVLRSSRKGCLRSSWRIMGKEVQLVNLHLYADVSNVVSSLSNPSEDALTRRAALEDVIRIALPPTANGGAGPARPSKRTKSGAAGGPAAAPNPTFFFGDFNFRLAYADLAKHISGGSRGTFTRDKDKGDDHPPSRVVFNKKGTKSPAVILEKKKFLVTDPSFYDPKHLASLRKFDQEGAHFKELHEMERPFLPTYPLDDAGGPDADAGSRYATTRAPAWCDRVLMNASAKAMVKKGHKYFIIGETATIGDHKPVALSVDLR